MEPTHLTHLLRQICHGGQDPQSRLASALHGELRRLAAFYICGENRQHTRQTTGPANDAFVRVVAACPMRGILVDYARSLRTKRSGLLLRVPLQEEDRLSGGKFDIRLAVDQ